MSKLDELVKEFCPDGVEWKTLGEIATDMYRGSGIKRDEVEDDGTPCVRYGEIYTQYNIWFDTCRSKTYAGTKSFSHGDVLFAITGESIEEIAKSCAYMGYDTCFAGGDIVVMKHNQNPKYVSYALSTTSAKSQKSKGKVKSKVVHSSVPALKAITIPVPPIPVQREVVRILDNFTELMAELTAELTARKKQYEYYKNELFNNADNIELLTLDMIAENCDSQRRAVSSGSREFGNIPYYGASGIVDYVKDYIFDGNYLLISEDGANLLARTTPIAFSISGKTWVNNHAHVLRFDEYATRRYIEMYLNSIDLTPYITGVAQPKLSQKNLNSIKIPLPPLSEQQRIVEILDKFDVLTTDISIGLPAEITARQKQYEYYRDKLLTFPKAETEV